MVSIDRCRAPLAVAALLLPGGACATGSEMAGLALAWPLSISLAAVGLVGLAALLYALLPAAWSRRKRSLVAVGLAPLAGVLLMLLFAGGGLLQMLLARLA